MKKKIVAMCATVAIAAVAVGGTLAYFTADDDATNTFTVGNVAIDLTEPNWDASGSQDAPEVYPGEALAKDPTVENTGANPCFVRISIEGLACLAPAGDITYRTDYVAGKLGDNWVEYEGYYYYEKVLAAGEKTDALFDQIVIPTDLKNGDGETKFDIDVLAQAVQAQGAQTKWADVQDMKAADIAKWFATCGL